MLRSRFLVLSALAITLLLATWLRLYRIDHQSYWNDEGNSLGLTSRSFGTIWRSAAADIHPPGYYLGLKGWAALTGRTELALRVFSALTGVLLMALLYRLGREYFGPGAGAAAALAGAFNPFLIYYAQEARMYALLATLAAGSFLLFSLWLRSSRPPAPAWGDRRLGAAFALVTAAGLYTHYAFGFVLLAQNVAALGGLLAHGRARRGEAPRARPAWRGRLGAWWGWQALALLAYLPWAPAAFRQLTTWPAERVYQPLGAAAADLGRYLVFGRTLPTAEAYAGLAGAGVLVLLALRQRGQTITPLLWLVVPAGLTLGLGLLSEPFAKFLLAAAPAACLLLGQGLTGVAGLARASAKAQGLGRRLRASGALLAGVASAAALAGGTYASLDNLYFDPAYARDDYRGIAQHLRALARPGDAVITIAPNQVEAFGYYHRDGAPVYPLPRARPLDPAATEAELAAIADRHRRLFVLYWGDEQADPERRVERWLNTHTFKAEERWYGQVRLATYATAAPASAPSTLSGARFGEHITLVGYSLPAESVAAGDSLQVTLFWRTDAPLEARYKVFVHLYSEIDQPPVAQQDGEPGGGLAPTSGWPAGEVIADNHGVLLPADLPPGRYAVQLGLYELFTGLRQPITLEGAAAGDRLPLGTITVK